MTSSASTFTYWSLLGLSPGSDANQLKKAFKREAKRWHPDLNQNSPNSEERFKWINEAYLVLSDPKKRFEWEVAGRPSFEIKEFAQHRSSESSRKSVSETDHNENVFNASEKFLILLVTSVIIFSINAFLY